MGYESIGERVYELGREEMLETGKTKLVQETITVFGNKAHPISVFSTVVTNVVKCHGVNILAFYSHVVLALRVRCGDRRRVRAHWTLGSLPAPLACLALAIAFTFLRR